MNLIFNRTNHQIAASREQVLYYGRNLQTNEPVAMKYYNFTLPDASQAVRTMSLLTRLSHPNLLRYYGVFESSEQTCVVQELAKETLV